MSYVVYSAQDRLSSHGGNEQRKGASRHLVIVLSSLILPSVRTGTGLDQQAERGQGRHKGVRVGGRTAQIPGILPDQTK